MGRVRGDGGPLAGGVARPQAVAVAKQVIGIALTQFVVGALMLARLYYLLIRLSGISLAAALLSIVVPPLVAAAAATAAVLGLAQVACSKAQDQSQFSPPM